MEKAGALYGFAAGNIGAAVRGQRVKLKSSRCLRNICLAHPNQLY